MKHIAEINRELKGLKTHNDITEYLTIVAGLTTNSIVQNVFRNTTDGFIININNLSININECYYLEFDYNSINSGILSYFINKKIKYFEYFAEVCLKYNKVVDWPTINKLKDPFLNDIELMEKYYLNCNEIIKYLNLIQPNNVPQFLVEVTKEYDKLVFMNTGSNYKVF